MILPKWTFLIAGIMVLSTASGGDLPERPVLLEEARQIVARLEWTISSFRDLPFMVQERLGGTRKSRFHVMADPGEDFNSGCIRIQSLPDKRMTYAACDREYCLVAYEHGGFALQRKISLFRYNQTESRVIWRGIPHGELTNYSAFKIAMKDGRVEQDSFEDPIVNRNYDSKDKVGK